MLDLLAEWLGGPFFTLNLRRVNKQLHKALPAPPRTRLLDLYALAAKQHSSKLAKLAHRTMLKRTGDHTPSDQHLLDEFMCDAASAGVKHLCCLAHDWGAGYYGEKWMLTRAALNGHADIVRLAWRWGVNDTRNTHNIMVFGARGGHEHICRMAKDMGDQDFDAMLVYAVESGNTALCELARSWGATDFGGMLHVAQALHGASKGEKDMVQLATKWCKESFPPITASYPRCWGVIN
ncbi:MAG: hypothetical protein P4L69_24130 [Desulfosporosinus sp.]|nr:hypothetical protein [Desulfosporosinus sp.]